MSILLPVKDNQSVNIRLASSGIAREVKERARNFSGSINKSTKDFRKSIANAAKTTLNAADSIAAHPNNWIHSFFSVLPWDHYIFTQDIPEMYHSSIMNIALTDEVNYVQSQKIPDDQITKETAPLMTLTTTGTGVSIEEYNAAISEIITALNLVDKGYLWYSFLGIQPTNSEKAFNAFLSIKDLPERQEDVGHSTSHLSKESKKNIDNLKKYLGDYIVKHNDKAGDTNSNLKTIDLNLNTLTQEQALETLNTIHDVMMNDFNATGAIKFETKHIEYAQEAQKIAQKNQYNAANGINYRQAKFPLIFNVFGLFGSFFIAPVLGGMTINSGYQGLMQAEASLNAALEEDDQEAEAAAKKAKTIATIKIAVGMFLNMVTSFAVGNGAISCLSGFNKPGVQVLKLLVILTHQGSLVTQTLQALIDPKSIAGADPENWVSGALNSWNSLMRVLAHVSLVAFGCGHYLQDVGKSPYAENSWQNFTYRLYNFIMGRGQLGLGLTSVGCSLIRGGLSYDQQAKMREFMTKEVGPNDETMEEIFQELHETQSTVEADAKKVMDFKEKLDSRMQKMFLEESAKIDKKDIPTKEKFKLKQKYAQALDAEYKKEIGKFSKEIQGIERFKSIRQIAQTEVNEFEEKNVLSEKAIKLLGIPESVSGFVIAFAMTAGQLAGPGTSFLAKLSKAMDQDNSDMNFWKGLSVAHTEFFRTSGGALPKFIPPKLGTLSLKGVKYLQFAHSIFYLGSESVKGSAEITNDVLYAVLGKEESRGWLQNFFGSQFMRWYGQYGWLIGAV